MLFMFRSIPCPSLALLWLRRGYIPQAAFPRLLCQQTSGWWTVEGVERREKPGHLSRFLCASGIVLAAAVSSPRHQLLWSIHTSLPSSFRCLQPPGPHNMAISSCLSIPGLTVASCHCCLWLTSRFPVWLSVPPVTCMTNSLNQFSVVNS